MADVDIKYKGASIATMNASGTKTLKTQGKYCEGDVIIEYTDPEKPTQSKTVTPTASGFTVNPDSGKVLSSVVVNGDANLAAGNIKKDVNIFGVVGTFEGGITPSGTKNITSNGTFDVTNFANADVNVQPQNFRQWTVEVPNKLTASTVLVEDNWLVQNYNQPNLTVVIEIENPSEHTAGYFCGGVISNMLLGQFGGVTSYGVFLIVSNDGTRLTQAFQATKLNYSGISVAGSVYLSGAKQLKVYGGHWIAGKYKITAWY